MDGLFDQDEHRQEGNKDGKKLKEISQPKRHKEEVFNDVASISQGITKGNKGEPILLFFPGDGVQGQAGDEGDEKLENNIGQGVDCGNFKDQACKDRIEGCQSKHNQQNFNEVFLFVILKSGQKYFSTQL